MGHIYILSNKHYFSGKLLKIGMTTRDVCKRVSEINQPFGVPPKFEILFYEQTNCPDLAEKIIHHKLKRHRINKRREFFLISEKDAVRTVKTVCKMLNDKQRHRPPLHQTLALFIMILILFAW